MARRRLGFTLTELVMVITIISILAVIVAPRFMSAGAFTSRGFFDEAKAVVRYAQKAAIARRQPIMICVEVGRMFAISNADCANPVMVPHPARAGNLEVPVPNGVTLGPAGSFSFDPLGRPTPAYVITLTSTVAGDPARSITVTAETGYVF
jgi:MSHA pilin protein MshC